MKKIAISLILVGSLTVGILSAKNLVKSKTSNVTDVTFVIDQNGFPQVTYIYDNGNINQMEKIVNQIESIQYSNEFSNKVFNVKYINN
ncbi:MAG: hypothetical protein H6553_07115 [Chitinophagales bacterium]|nr:hypothetical protein [Chitinophagales bacterium]